MIAVGILVATFAALVISFTFYAIAPAAPTPEPAADGRPKWWQIVIEIVRSALVASLVAGLLFVGDWHGPLSGLLLGLALAVLPIVLLAGSVLWENIPMRSAATHLADWIIKLAAIGAIVGTFA